MRIALYVGKDKFANTENTSLYNMVAGMREYFERFKHEVVVADTLAKCAKTDIVVNIDIASGLEIEESRRFTGCGKQVIIFSANVLDFSRERLVGYIMVAEKVTVVLHSLGLYNAILKFIEVFSISTMKRVRENLVYIPYGIGTEFVSGGVNDKNLWMFPFNRWNEIQKQAEKTFDVMVKAKQLLANDSIILRYNTLPGVNDTKKSYAAMVDSKEVSICPCPLRAEYVTFCKSVGVFVSLSNYESFGIQYLEMLSSGVVGVFLKKPWVDALLPGYKLCASSIEEMIMLVVSVYSDYERASKYIHTKAIPYIQKKYALETFHEKLLALF